MDVNIMAGGRVGQPGLARCTPAVGKVGRLPCQWLGGGVTVVATTRRPHVTTGAVLGKESPNFENLFDETRQGRPAAPRHAVG